MSAQSETSPAPDSPDHSPQAHPAPEGTADSAAAAAALAALHGEAARHFCDCATRMTELWQESVSSRSAASPGLLESCLRLQVGDEIEQLIQYCRSLVAREEQALRRAGMRRFGQAWREHKRSHARLLRRLERRARHCATEPPGELARNVAMLLEDYWALHFPDHDRLALSLLALLESGEAEQALAIEPPDAAGSTADRR
ncbi:MAG: hypothetical protein H6945_16445 [Zoogloeaceae bacterium]|nr:hypothetical protein [Rhodocyclaceae bacterium]MCP5237328.1 hypothetical protein [Zoogloeaceae bacterium]